VSGANDAAQVSASKAVQGSRIRRIKVVLSVLSGAKAAQPSILFSTHKQKRPDTVGAFSSAAKV